MLCGKLKDNNQKQYIFLTKATHVTFIFELEISKSIKVLSLPRPISMGKYERPVINSFKIIIGNYFVYGRTDGPTDIPTDISKTIRPLFFEGGIK